MEFKLDVVLISLQVKNKSSCMYVLAKQEHQEYLESLRFAINGSLSTYD
jgi:hypothetical protein